MQFLTASCSQKSDSLDYRLFEGSTANVQYDVFFNLMYG